MKSFENLTVEEGSLKVFLIGTSLDLDSDAIVTDGLGLETINLIIFNSSLI